MTLVVDLTAEEESTLRRRAARAGLDERAFVRRLITGQKTVGAPRHANATPVVAKGYGKFAHVNTSSEDFARRKADEIEREDRRR